MKRSPWRQAWPLRSHRCRARQCQRRRPGHRRQCRLGGKVKNASDNPMYRANAAPRCSAMSKRSGQSCKAPALRGWNVCRFHGARGGAPKGQANGRYRHGQFSCQAIEQRQALALLIRMARLSAFVYETNTRSRPHWREKSLEAAAGPVSLAALPIGTRRRAFN